MTNMCIFGNRGVGKTFLKEAIQGVALKDRRVFEIDELKEHPDRVRSFLQTLGDFVAVFVVTTEGGRLQSDDAELLQLFRSRSYCCVVINKTTESCFQALAPRIGSFFESGITVCWLPLLPTSEHILNCWIMMRALVPQPYQAFLLQHEELQQLRQKAAEQKSKQEEELQKVETEKQRLLKEQETTKQALDLANKQLQDHENKRKAAIALAYARTAERQRQDQVREQQRRQAEFAAQRRQEDERQRARDAQFRQQIANSGRFRSPFS